MSVLVCENIHFNDKQNSIIKSFNFNFLENKVYGIVGRRQSGKTTLLKLLSGQISPTEGQVYLDGKVLFNNSKINNRICFIDKDLIFPNHLKVKDIFKLMANYYPKWDNSYAYELINFFGIKPNNYFSKLRKDLQSVFTSIIGLASRANITILDEPLKYADPKDRYDFFNFLYEHFEIYPRTFILSTNYIDEIEFAIHSVLFLDNGRLFDYYPIKELKENFVYLSGKTEVLKSLISGVKIIGVEERANMLSVCIRQKLSKDDIRKYKKYLIKISEVPIQMIFIHLINLREKKGIS